MKKHAELLNIILFSSGKFASDLGTAVYTFAVGLYVLKFTGSGLSFAVTLLLGIAPVIIVSPAAGVLADRFSKKTIIMMMDVLNGLLFFSVFALTSAKSHSLMPIYAGIFLSSVFTTFFGISMETGKPYIVSDEKLLKLNAISKILDAIPAILGPVLGGLVFVFIDIRAFMVINGVSFLMSAFTELFIDFNYNVKQKEQNPNHEGFIDSMKGGILYIRQRRDIIKLFKIFVVLNFFISFSVSVPIPYILNNTLNLSPGSYGLIQGAFPVGLILGSLIIKWIALQTDSTGLLLRISSGMALCMVLIGAPLISYDSFGTGIYIAYYLCIMLCIGIGIALIDIPIIYYLQTNIPDAFRGRVLSLGMSSVKIIAPIGYLLSGILIAMYPVQLVSIIGGGFLMISLYAMSRKKEAYQTDTAPM